MPRWINFIDKANFIETRSAFELLLSLDSNPNIWTEFVIHKFVQMIPMSEPFDDTFPVLPHTFQKITGHTNIQNRVPFVCQDIYGWLFFHVITVLSRDEIASSSLRGLLAMTREKTKVVF